MNRGNGLDLNVQHVGAFLHQLLDVAIKLVRFTGGSNSEPNYFVCKSHNRRIAELVNSSSPLLNQVGDSEAGDIEPIKVDPEFPKDTSKRQLAIVWPFDGKRCVEHDASGFVFCELLCGLVAN